MTTPSPFSPPAWWRLLGAATRLPARVLSPGRFGPWPVAGQPTVWFHAASLGEAKGVLRVASALEGTALTLTATTMSGLERLRRERPDLECFLLPWDDPGTIDAFLAKRRVAKAVFLESDAWPSAFGGLAARSIPVAMAAVRCGERSRVRWKRLGWLFPGLTESVGVAWADGPRIALSGLGFGNVRSGASLKWAGVPPRTVPVVQGRTAVLSYHLRDLPALVRLVRTHPGRSWLWFPRRTGLAPLSRLLARTMGLELVPHDRSPTAGGVWIASRLGLVTTRLPGCEEAWVAPGHDREEPLRLGVPRLLAMGPTRDSLEATPEQTLRELVDWILAPAAAGNSQELRTEV